MRAKLSWAQLYPVALLLCVLLTWRPIKGSNDLFANAAIGRWVAGHGGVPHSSLFLWTTQKPFLPHPFFWVAHHWVSDLCFYALLQGGGQYGPTLIMGFTLSLVLLPFALLWRLAEGGGRLEASRGLFVFCAFVVTLLLGAPRFVPRPETFTAGFLAALLCLLLRWKQWEAATALKMGSLGVFFALWANCHGAVAYGLILIGGTAVCELAQERASPAARQVALAALAATFAMLATPYGFAYLSVFQSVHSYTFATIEEWQPIWADPFLGWSVLVEAGLLVAAAVALWIANPARRWSQLSWMLAMAYFLATARRNIWVFGLVYLAVIIANTPKRLGWRSAGSSGTGEEIPGYSRPDLGLSESSAPAQAFAQPTLTLSLSHTPAWAWARRAGSLSPLVAILLAVGWFAWPIYLGVPFLTPYSDKFPTGMVAYLRSHPAPRRLFNDYNSSPYYEWALGESVPLFIDKVNAYPDSVTKTYDEICHTTDKGREAFFALGIDCVAWDTPDDGDHWPNLTQLYLSASPDWELVYAGRDGKIWRRR